MRDREYDDYYKRGHVQFCFLPDLLYVRVAHIVGVERGLKTYVDWALYVLDLVVVFVGRQDIVIPFVKVWMILR